MGRGRALLLLIASNLLWAGSYVAGKVALGGLDPIELNAARFTIAGAIFLPLLLRSGLRVDRRLILRLAPLTLFGFVLNKLGEYSGLALSTASDIALLIAAEGIFTAIFGWILLRERVRGIAVAGLVVGGTGVYLVIERGLTTPHLGGGTRVIGDVLIVLSLVFEALYSVLGKAETARFSPIVLTAGCVVGSLTVWIPAGVVRVVMAGVPHLTIGQWAGLLYLAIPGTVLAYLGWISALRSTDASTAAPTLFLQPLAGTLLAVLLLGEQLRAATIVGGVLILAGIWIVSMLGRRAEVLAGVTEHPM